MEPIPMRKRHPILKGFEETDLISYGGNLGTVIADSSSEVLMTFVPSFPIYPPETAWMREPKTDIPGLILNTKTLGGRVAYMPADLDRQFGRYNLPDHGDLIANLVRWVAKENIPINLECAGLIDCNIFNQKDRMVLHLVNLTSAGTWRQPVDEYIPVGPVKVKLKLSKDIRGKALTLLVSGQKVTPTVLNGWVSFTVNSITDHEVVIIS